MTLIYPNDHSIIDTHTDIQNGFIDLIHERGIAAALDWLTPQKGDNELSFPKSVRFTWAPEGVEPYVFELAENNTFSPSYTVRTADTFLEVTNLKIGQKYYWRVNGGNYRTFETKDNKFRFIEIDGVLNVRDLGGINIKQGLLYRGSEINKEYKITEDGKKVFKEQLNIKTEINIRKGEMFEKSKSCMGEEVSYKYLPYRPYTEIFEDEHRKGICEIMEFLAQEENYPIYFHCLGGADRTGMIAFFLRALLGESNEDILIDYELTSLSSYAYGLAEGVDALGFRSRETDYFREFISLFNAYKGNSFSEKTESFLLECNIKPSTLERVRSILKK